MCSGMELQINVAQTLKERWPVDVWIRGFSSKNWSDDLNKRGGAYSLINEIKFSGWFYRHVMVCMKCDTNGFWQAQTYCFYGINCDLVHTISQWYWDIPHTLQSSQIEVFPVSGGTREFIKNISPKTILALLDTVEKFVWNNHHSFEIIIIAHPWCCG